MSVLNMFGYSLTNRKALFTLGIIKKFKTQIRLKHMINEQIKTKTEFCILILIIL